MLRDLHVRNLAILADVSVEFDTGLNVLTGETGAGKSIVVDSLALLAGARASSELIRSGTDLLSVTGVFAPAGEAWRETLTAAGIESEGDELVVRREISREGRNRVFLNDQPVTLTLLAAIAPRLLRIHTQREELGLVSPELQRSWLDRSGGEEGRCLRARAAELYDSWAALAARLERARGDDRLREERIDLLRFQVSEIDAARVREGEEEELRQEREMLRHAEVIRESLALSYELLFDDEGAVDRLARAAKRLSEASRWDPAAGEWSRRLEELTIDLQELATGLGGRLDQVEADPRRLDAVEERLALLERLLRKYGGTSEALLVYRRAAGAELEELRQDVEGLEGLTERAAGALAEYREAAAELSRRRDAWARELEAQVHRELRDLAMGKARFGVALERRPRASSPLAVGGERVDFSADGYDQVTFRLAANPGEEPQPLARSASGGELSRVYLAVQLAARGDGEAAASTLVFDEVDAGIGGAQAAALGRKLKRLARGGQILAVTHLPQVASHGDAQFKVSKRSRGDRTVTEVARLEGRDRVEEVARMLAGRKVTELSISHAEELIASGRLGS